MVSVANHFFFLICFARHILSVNIRHITIQTKNNKERKRRDGDVNRKRERRHKRGRDREIEREKQQLYLEYATSNKRIT